MHYLYELVEQTGENAVCNWDTEEAAVLAQPFKFHWEGWDIEYFFFQCRKDKLP